MGRALSDPFPPLGTTGRSSTTEDEDLAGTTAGHSGTTGLLKILRESQSRRLEIVTGTAARLAGNTARGAITVINTPTYKKEKASSPRAHINFSLLNGFNCFKLRRSLSLSLANQIPQDLVDWERSPRSTILPKWFVFPPPILRGTWLDQERSPRSLLRVKASWFLLGASN
jgi:hypothetical protein